MTNKRVEFLLNYTLLTTIGLLLAACTYEPDSDRVVQYNLQVLAFWAGVVPAIIAAVAAWLANRNVNKMSKKLDVQQDELVDEARATQRAVAKVHQDLQSPQQGDENAKRD